MHWSDSSGDVPSASGNVNVWDGYVGVWHMNATGTTAEPDKTGHGLNAVPYITSGTANINSDANGKVGSGRANIANANLRVSNYSGNLTSSTKFTMSGWMKLSAKGSWPRIFVGNPSNGDRSCWEIWRESDSQVKVNGGNSSTTATFNLGLGTGTWYYLTLVYDGTSVTLYSNGNSQGSGTVATPAHKTYLSIGGAGTTADRSIVGTFDEVRMYNGALSADRVAADYDTMNDPTAFITLASAPQAAALTHRWSFNTDGYDYTDSITGAAPASKFGNDGNRKTQGGKLVLTGSGSGQGSLGLGKNLLGSGDATVEIWASHDAAKNYARVFDYGNGSYGRNPNQTDCFIFAWSAGTEVSRDIVLLKKANATAFERHGTMSALEWGKQYYFAVTFKDNGDGSSTIKWMRRDAVTGALERYMEETVSGWTLATLAATNPDFWLGVSKYSTDHDANASYDEVRIWNGALGEDQLAANAAMGPNALTTGLSVGFNLAAGAVFRVPSVGYTASGAVTLGAGAKLLFDTASFDGQSITFSATGFTVPSGGILDYVELTDSVNFTASLSGSLITVTRNASAPVTAQWAGASAPASAADLAVAANWTCRDASGNVVAGVVPGAATTIVIPDGTTSFTIPSDATPTWAGIRFGEHSGTKWGQNGSNGTGSSYTWRDTALKDYAFKGDGSLANLNGANTSWQTTNMKAKRVRFDGWVNVPAEKAGRWYLSQAFDDYFTFAIDGEWVLHSNNYNYYTYLNYDVTPGWHRFTVVCGDTFGGFGSGSIDVGGVKVPFSFSVNGGAAQRFDQLTQGSGNSTVQLAADCDWSALGTINLSNGTVIDLNGHNLTIYDATADFLGAMITNTSATTSTLFFERDYASSAAGIQELVKGVGSSIIVAQKGAIVPDWTWTGAQDSAFATAGNWAKGASVATDLAGAVIGLPSGVSQTFSYVTWDPVALSTTTFLVEGSAAFNDVGGFYLRKLMIEATGRITYDPTKFTFRLVLPPAFASGAKIALASKYAANTKGRFLLMTWDSGSLDMDATALTDVFDAASASGTNPKVWAENLEGGGGRLWLDLDYGATKVRVNVLPVGDSITHGNDNGWGNWRTGLMKKLAAAGYEPIAKGHRFDQSHDICGAMMPDEWISHSGIGAQRLITAGGGAGTIDAIENFLDQAGDVDFVLCKLGTNDICGNTLPETLYAAWTNLAWKILNQKPAVKLIAGAVVDIDNTTWNQRVISYNSMVSNAIASAMFPTKRAYFADLYTPCYRRDSNNNYIEGSFYNDGVNTLHPDWPNEDKIADAYCASILGALADDPSFTPGQAEANVPTTSGAEVNVPAAYLDGFARARVFDVAAYNGTNLATRGSVPYEDYSGSTAVTQGIGRVGYYIELKRKDDGVHQYHGLTRWLWVSMDAFGDRTIDMVGVPLAKVYQGAAAHLKVASNVRIVLVKEGDGTFSSSGFALGNQAYEVDFVQTNGTANHTSAQIGISGHHGVYRMSGGTVKATGDFEVGPNGVGEFLQSGGSVTLQNWFNIGRYKNGNGTYTITGGSLLVNKASNGGADKVYVGNASNSSGTLNVGGSGQVQFSCHLSLGSQLDGNGGKGYANVYENGNLLTTGNIWIGQTGGETGEFRQTGGIAQCNGTTYVCNEDNSSGLLDISGTGEYRAAGGMTVGANGTLNVHDGGRLVAKSISTSKSTAKATFDGGTVVLTNITDGASLFGGFSSITVGAGGLTLDTAGHNVTMATASNVLASAGSTFTKTGNGTLSVGSLPQVDAVSVAKGTLALSASYDNTAMLAHRWSFNGEGNDYTDSITGNSASTFGNADKRATTGGKLVLNGNGSGQGSLNLGKGLLGLGDATVEIWASNDAVKHYARVFDYGNGSYASNPGQTDCFLFIWSTGTDATKDIVQLKKNNTAVINKSGTMSVMELGKQYYFAFTFKDNGDGSTTIKWVRRDVVTGALERSDEATVSDWTLATLFAKNPDFWLGVSKYSGDSDANASYDEVRIWNGALSDEAIALSATKGPDATAADIAEIVAASPAGRTLTLESGATLSIGAGNTLVQPVVSGGGTVSGGTLKVANELLVTDLDDCLIVDGGTLDIDGAKVVFSAAALQALAATGRTYTLVSAVNGGTITGSPLQPTDLPPGWRVKTTSSSMILRKDGMSIHIR